MKPHGRKWRFEHACWQPQKFGLRLYFWPLGYPTGYRKRMKA